MSTALFPETPREAARDWMRRQLAAALGRQPDEPEIGERAENFLALVELHKIEDREFIVWIQTRRPGKEWSLAEARSWCETYASERAKLAELSGSLPPDAGPWPADTRCGHCGALIHSEADAAHHVCEILCPRCYGSSAQRVEGRWICTNCGEVE